jgi:transcriptional regulator with XRE-family HTH domain
LSAKDGNGKQSQQARRSRGSRSLGDRIRKFRTKLCLSQEAVAHLIERSEGWLLQVENGRADPGYSDLLKLAEALKVDLRQLLEDEHDPAARPPVRTPPPTARHAASEPLVAYPPTLDSERISHVWQRPAAVDTSYLDQLESLIRLYWQQYHTISPNLMLPAVSSHIAQLWPLVGGSSPPTTERRLRSLIGQAASLTGWLMLRLENRTAASLYWALAEALATEAEDQTLRRFALASRSSLYSSTLRGGHGGDTILALALLDASTDGGPAVPPVQRAWTHSRRAEEHAVAGDADAAQRDMDEATRYFAQVNGQENGYFAAWEEAQLTGYRGSCAQALGSPEAITLLEASLAATDTSLISQRTAILTNLGAAHVKRGHVDETCAALTEALTIATHANLAVAIQRIRGVRGRLDPWSSARAVRHLDRLIQGAP